MHQDIAVNLPVNPPILPMLAKRVDDVPAGGDWIFEPKWDGFRVLIFRDGDEILIQSRDTKPLNRYFPDMLDPLRAQLPERCVLDGELVIAREGRLDFDALQLRIHPAASRVKMLAAQMPASVVFFDLLCVGDRDLRDRAVCHAPRRIRIAACERRRRRSTSRPPRAIATPHATGFIASKARASTAWWPSPSTAAISPTSASC